MMKSCHRLAFPLAFALAAAGQSPVQWVGTWAAAPMAAAVDASPMPSAGRTYRDVVHLSLGGKTVRLRLSNELGTAPLVLGSVHIALSSGKDSIQSGSDHRVTFGGSETVSLPSGALAVSDPIAMSVSAFSDLAISLYLPEQTVTTATYHALGMSTNFIVEGNAVSALHLASAQNVTSWYFLKGIDVDAGPGATAVVTLGDSITDGTCSTLDANHRWPDLLARRLQANPDTSHTGVLNEGISGNRLLHDGAGPNALARLDRDVLSQPAVTHVILLLGINDIGRTTMPRVPADRITTEQVIWSLRQIAERVHTRGLKIDIATLTPYEGAAYQDPAGSAMRDRVNAFIRSSKDFDAVLDFDSVVRDPAHPEALLPAFDSGDHLHPNDAGYRAMADSINLALLRR